MPRRRISRIIRLKRRGHHHQLQRAACPAAASCVFFCAEQKVSLQRALVRLVDHHHAVPREGRVRHASRRSMPSEKKLDARRGEETSSNRIA